MYTTPAQGLLPGACAERAMTSRRSVQQPPPPRRSEQPYSGTPGPPLLAREALDPQLLAQWGDAFLVCTARQHAAAAIISLPLRARSGCKPHAPCAPPVWRPGREALPRFHARPSAMAGPDDELRARCPSSSHSSAACCQPYGSSPEHTHTHSTTYCWRVSRESRRARARARATSSPRRHRHDSQRLSLFIDVVEHRHTPATCCAWNSSSAAAHSYPAARRHCPPALRTCPSHAPARCYEIRPVLATGGVGVTREGAGEIVPPPSHLLRVWSGSHIAASCHTLPRRARVAIGFGPHAPALLAPGVRRRGVSFPNPASCTSSPGPAGTGS
mmetsp:Transcript_9920/g.26943  ORF Transcript_9920/g.26943 Transcript_9920/m.26943 type:complete len:329 (-) Transcript_9920:390-1376(-)